MNDYLQHPDATYIDVRSDWEFESGHLEKAIHIPLELLMDNLQVLQSLPKPIVFYCRSGNRSGMAMTMAKNAGISEVINGGSLTDLSKKVMSHV